MFYGWCLTRLCLYMSPNHHVKLGLAKYKRLRKGAANMIRRDRIEENEKRIDEAKDENEFWKVMFVLKI